MSGGESNNNRKRLAARNLTREKVQQLLLAIGSEPMKEATNTEATDYEWQRPHHFTEAELRMLDHFTKRVATLLAEKLATLCHSDFGVTITSTSQHFACQILDQVLTSKQNDYYVAFGMDKNRPCGVICVPPQTATNWVTQLLGDSASETGAGKDLSPLEESLLIDICRVVIEAFSASARTGNFQPSETLGRGQLPLEMTGIEELCRITLSVEKNTGGKAEPLGEAHFLILSDKLKAMVGAATRKSKQTSPADVSNAILSHLHQVPVTVTGQLATAWLSFEELMAIQEGDTILLDKRVEEQIDLTVQGRSLFVGRPAKSGGKHAVFVTGLAEEVTSESDVAEADEDTATRANGIKNQ